MYEPRPSDFYVPKLGTKKSKSWDMGASFQVCTICSNLYHGQHTCHVCCLHVIRRPGQLRPWWPHGHIHAPKMLPSFWPQQHHVSPNSKFARSQNADLSTVMDRARRRRHFAPRISPIGQPARKLRPAEEKEPVLAEKCMYATHALERMAQAPRDASLRPGHACAYQAPLPTRNNGPLGLESRTRDVACPTKRWPRTFDGLYTFTWGEMGGLPKLRVCRSDGAYE